MLNKTEKDLFKIFNNNTKKQFAKLLTTTEDNLYSLFKLENIKIFNKIISNSSKIGTMNFLLDNQNYTVKFMSLYGIPYILDDSKNNSIIIIRKFDLSRIP